MSHLSDDELIAILENEELGPNAAHLHECADCAGALAQLRQLTSTMKEEAVWSTAPLPEAPNPQTIATLRAIADQMDEEDDAATAYVAALLTGPREQWSANLAEHPEWRTPGVVRRLIEEIDPRIDSRPADVVVITELAANIADSLDPARWYGDTVVRLRACAWRDHAYALHYVGRHVDALDACDRSAELMTAVADGEFDAARLALVRAATLRELERLDEALVTAISTATVFGHHGDHARWQHGRMLEAAVAYARSDYRRAAAVLEEVAVASAVTAQQRTRAVVLQNLAGCYRELGDFSRALAYFGEAVRLFDELKMDADRTRAKWHIGRVLLLEGKYRDAAMVLRAVKDTYQSLCIRDKAALAALDLAEASLMLGRSSDVLELCRFAIAFYRDSQFSYSQSALAALSLIREAAEIGKLPSSEVKRVRTYLERLPQQPRLLFARLEE